MWTAGLLDAPWRRETPHRAFRRSRPQSSSASRRTVGAFLVLELAPIIASAADIGRASAFTDHTFAPQGACMLEHQVARLVKAPVYQPRLVAPRAAGINLPKGLSAHGLRKAMPRRLAELGLHCARDRINHRPRIPFRGATQLPF